MNSVNMLLTVLWFAFGIVLVVKGGDWFVSAASWIARALNVPPFIIGATIVSVATTMPEMIVSVLAAHEGKVDMAVGNAVGSVTANTALIMAISMIAMVISCPRKKYKRQILILIAAAAILLLASLRGSLALWGSLLLAVLFVLFMTENILSAKRDAKVDSPRMKAEGNVVMRNVLLFLLGAASIVMGSQLMVNNGSVIAAALGVPERVIAVTLIAVGTSLPELVTTVTAIVKREGALSVGNIIGANIIDLSLILPLCSLVAGKPLPIAPQSLFFDLPACLLVTLLMAIPVLIRQKTSRAQGICLLLTYAAYLILTV